MRIFLLIALYLVFHLSAIGQNFDNYETLISQGTVPKDFIQRSSEKVAADVAALTKEKGRIKKQKKKFYLESNFNVDKFLSSGRVLFNDEVTQYVSRVLTEILKPYPDLQKKVRVYTVKSSVVNAFTVNNGIIFVNLGLLARLENEAQLAFILAHEVTHYQKSHAINSFITQVEIERGKGDYRNLSREERLFAKCTYSKEFETEADLGAAEIYLKSSYSRDSIQKVFDVLKNADLPLCKTRFNKSIFEFGSYVFPDTLLLKEVKNFVLDENYDDSKSTHPNIKKRKEAILPKFSNGGDKKGDKFKVSKSSFEKIQKIAQYELCRQFLLEQNYLEALTLALSLQQENQDSPYLQETIAKSFYGLTKRKIGSYTAVDHAKWFEEPQRFAYFIENLSTYELGVLALRQLNKCFEKNPTNEGIGLMLTDLMKSLADEEKDFGKGFMRTTSASPIAGLQYPYTQYAFLDSKDPAAFFKLLDKQIDETNKTREQKSRKKKKIKKQKVDVKKVVIVNPFYRKYDSRKKDRVRHADAEEFLIELNDRILSAAQEVDLQTEIVNPNKISSSSIKIMQTSSIINDFLFFKMETGEDKMISPIHNEMVALANAYKTDYFLWMGGSAITYPRSGRGYYVPLALILPPLIPLLAWSWVTPSSDTLYFALVFNVRTEQLELVDIRKMGTRDSEPLIKSNIYYSLLKLKNYKK